MKRIVLVDDDGDMLALTGRWLTKAGYEVSSASSGKEALDIISAVKPDLILLDFFMPEMDGPAVLKEIRSNDETKNIPVLYRTGMDDADADAEFKPDGIVPKADGKPGLLKALEKFLA